MSILNYIKAIFSNDLYIQIWENRIKISRLGTYEKYDQEPLIAIKNKKKRKSPVVGIGDSVKTLGPTEYDKIVNPFKHPRVLVHDFSAAEKVIQHAVRSLHKGMWGPPAPRVIFHPMEKLEGGITEIEEKVYRELCMGAGAREALIHIGQELCVGEGALDFDEYKRKNS